MTASKPSAVISAVTHPANAAAQPLDWKVTNAEGVVVPYAALEQIDDTHIRILAFAVLRVPDVHTPIFSFQADVDC